MVEHTYINQFTNGQRCALRLVWDGNKLGAGADWHNEEPRFEEIEDEYREWRLKSALNFVQDLPDPGKAVAALRGLNRMGVVRL